MDTGAWWATVWGGNKLGHDLATKQQQQRWVEKFFIFPRADSTSKAHLQKEKLMWLSFAEMWKPRKALAQQRQGTDGEGAQTPFPGQPHMGSSWRWSTSRATPHPAGRHTLRAGRMGWSRQPGVPRHTQDTFAFLPEEDAPGETYRTQLNRQLCWALTIYQARCETLGIKGWTRPPSAPLSQSQTSPRNRQLSHNWAGFPPNLQGQEANPNLFFQSSLV